MNYEKREVLIVEDDPVFLKDLTTKLILMGFPDPVMTSFGEDAVEYCKNKTFDLILMDIELDGKMDGIETAKIIIEDSKTIAPIVYMTAFPETDVKTSITNLLPYGYITKPFSDRELEIIIAIAIQRNEYEKQILDKQVMLESVLETSVNRIFLKDKQAKYYYANTSFYNATGLNEEKLIGKTCLDLHPDKDIASRIYKEDQDILSGREKFIVEERLDHFSGGVSNSFISKAPIYNSSNDICGIASISTDITDLKKTQAMIDKVLKEKDALIKELHDRIKNNMQIVNSLFSIQSSAQRYKPVSHILDDCRSRISAMGRVHEHVYREENFSRVDISSAVHSTVSYLKQLYDVENHVSLKCSGGKYAFDVKNAVPFLMIVNEAFSNSLKHAFPDEKEILEKKIMMNCLKENESLIVSINDNGIGIENIPNYDSSETVGLFLMQALSKQLGADIDIHGKEGTEVVLRIPSSHVIYSEVR